MKRTLNLLFVLTLAIQAHAIELELSYPSNTDKQQQTSAMVQMPIQSFYSTSSIKNSYHVDGSFQTIASAPAPLTTTAPERNVIKKGVPGGTELPTDPMPIENGTYIFAALLACYVLLRRYINRKSDKQNN